MTLHSSLKLSSWRLRFDSFPRSSPSDAGFFFLVDPMSFWNFIDFFGLIKFRLIITLPITNKVTVYNAFFYI